MAAAARLRSETPASSRPESVHSELTVSDMADSPEPEVPDDVSSPEGVSPEEQEARSEQDPTNPEEDPLKQEEAASAAPEREEERLMKDEEMPVSAEEAAEGRQKPQDEGPDGEQEGTDCDGELKAGDGGEPEAQEQDGQVSGQDVNKVEETQTAGSAPKAQPENPETLTKQQSGGIQDGNASPPVDWPKADSNAKRLSDELNGGPEPVPDSGDISSDAKLKLLPQSPEPETAPSVSDPELAIEDGVSSSEHPASDPNVANETDSKTSAGPVHGPEPEPVSKSEDNRELEPEAREQPAREPEPESMPEPNHDPEPEPKLDVEPQLEPELEKAPETEFAAAPAPVPAVTERAGRSPQRRKPPERRRPLVTTERPRVPTTRGQQLLVERKRQQEEEYRRWEERERSLSRRRRDAPLDSGGSNGREPTRNVSPRRERLSSNRLDPLDDKPKKLPMNRIQVGLVASPNVADARSRVGSLANAGHRPGGGGVKIERHRLDHSQAAARVQARSDHRPGGGNRKIVLQKLEWNGQPKIGSLANARHKPGGGNVQVETQRLDFKRQASSKIGSRDNIHHRPGGGDVKLLGVSPRSRSQSRSSVECRPRLPLSAVSSKIGSLDNVGHRPRGGERRIFDDTAYLRQVRSLSAEGRLRHLSLAPQPAGGESPALLNGRKMASRSPSRSRKSPAPGGKSPAPRRKSLAPPGQPPASRKSSAENSTALPPLNGTPPKPQR